MPASRRRRYYRAGIPIAEITMTVPKAIDVISHLAKKLPDMVVGAGTVLDTETAQRCMDAGAKFLTSPGLVTEVVEFAVKKDVVVFPGALTPTEVITAWKAGADFVKIFPCAQVGGPVYLRRSRCPAASAVDRIRRCKSGERHQLHSGGSHGAGHWQRADAARSGTPAARRTDPGTRAPVHQHGERRARTTCRSCAAVSEQ